MLGSLRHCCQLSKKESFRLATYHVRIQSLGLLNSDKSKVQYIVAAKDGMDGQHLQMDIQISRQPTDYDKISNQMATLYVNSRSLK